MSDRAQAHIGAIAANICAKRGDQLAAVRAAALAIEAPVLRSALERSGWSMTAAARVLGCQVGAMRSALKRHPSLAQEARIKGPPPPVCQRK